MKYLILILSAFVFAGCGTIPKTAHECGIEAVNFCGVDNVRYSYVSIFGVKCMNKCDSYDKFHKTPKQQ